MGAAGPRFRRWKGASSDGEEDGEASQLQIEAVGSWARVQVGFAVVGASGPDHTEHTEQVPTRDHTEQVQDSGDLGVPRDVVDGLQNFRLSLAQLPLHK
jgi:hypothetical protein